jgi:serine/threonine protein kinase
MNIFLKKNNLIRIGDFGVAKTLLDEKEFTNTLTGTPFYFSPEVCKEMPYDSKSDIWALGCLLYELCCKTQPFKSKGYTGLKRMIKKGSYQQIPMFYTTDMNHLISMMLETQPDDRPTVQQILETEIIQRHIGESMLVRDPKNEELRDIYETFQKEMKDNKMMTPLKFDPITKKMVSTFEMVAENEELIQLKGVDDFAEEEFGDGELDAVKKKKPSFLEQQRLDFQKKFNKKGGYRVKDDQSRKLFRNANQASGDIREKKKFEKKKDEKKKSAYTKMFLKKKQNSGSTEKQIETGMFYSKSELKQHNKEQARKWKKPKERKFKKPAKPWVGVMEEEEEVLQKEKEKEEEEKRKEEEAKKAEARKKKVVMRRKKSTNKRKSKSKKDGTNGDKESKAGKKVQTKKVSKTKNVIPRVKNRRIGNRNRKKQVPLNKASVHPRADSVASDFSVESINKEYSEGVVNKIWGRKGLRKVGSEKKFAEVFKPEKEQRRVSVTKVQKKGQMHKGILIIEIEKLFPKIKNAEQYKNLEKLNQKIQVVEYLHTRKLCGRLAMRRNKGKEKEINSEIPENFHYKMFEAMKEMFNEEWSYEVEKLEIENEYFLKKESEEKLRREEEKRKQEEKLKKAKEIEERQKEWYRQFNEAQEIKRKEEEERQKEYEAQFESLREMQFVEEPKEEEENVEEEEPLEDEEKEEKEEGIVQQEEMDNEFKGKDIDLVIENEVVVHVSSKVDDSGEEEEQREEKGGDDVQDEVEEEIQDEEEIHNDKEMEENEKEGDEEEEEMEEIDEEKTEEKEEKENGKLNEEEKENNVDEAIEENLENDKNVDDDTKDQNIENEVTTKIEKEEDETENKNEEKEDEAENKEEKEIDNTQNIEQEEIQALSENQEDQINIFKESLQTSKENTIKDPEEFKETLKRYETSKFPNDNEEIPPPMFDEPEKPLKTKKLVPLEKPNSDQVQVRKNKFRQSYEDIIDYKISDNLDKDERVNRLNQQRDRIKGIVNVPRKISNRDRIYQEDRSMSPDLQNQSEISEMYRNIKNLSRARKMEMENMIQAGRDREDYPRNYYPEQPDINNFQSFGNEDWRQDTLDSNRSTLSKRQEVLNRTDKDYEISQKRRLSPNRNRRQILRKKESREELGDRVKQQRDILRLQYQKNVIMDNVKKSIPDSLVDGLLDEISQSMRQKGAFTLMDSKRVQRELFGDLDYYQRKELPSLYKLMDLEVELLVKTGY